MNFVFHLYALDCFSVEQIEQSAFFEIAFTFQPLGPALLGLVLQQQRQMGQKGGDFLTAGSPQVEIKADGPVNFFADAFGKLVELRAFEFLLEQVEVEVCPGNEQKGKQKIVRLAMVAAGDGLLV